MDVLAAVGAAILENKLESHAELSSETEFSKILGSLYQPWMLQFESNERELNLSWVLDVGLLAFVEKDEP